jgi:NAD(P)-dependent dehydrogenase (short-subunit alcohol dehydrogenase family)
MSRIALVTGASTGIGRSTALKLAGSGWRVYAGVRRDADGRTLEREAAGELRALRLDLEQRDSLLAAAARLGRETEGRLDALVNNAGVYHGGPLELMKPEEIDQTYVVNVTGLLQLTRACLPLLRAARGRIVNISSISGLLAMPGVSVYAGSKHAVEAVTDSLRVELRPFGIRVIAVAPGGVQTPIWEKGAARDAAAREDPDAAELRRLYAPLVRLLEKLNARPGGVPPETVAGTVVEALETAKPKNRYLVGGDAKGLALLNHLPDALRDRVIAARVWS